MKKFQRLFCILLLLVSFLPAQTQTPVIPQDVVKHLRKAAALSMIGGSQMHRSASPFNVEKYAAIEANGNIVYGDLQGELGGSTTIPTDTVLLLHTHPWNASPRPSRVDVETAHVLTAPNCAVSLNQIWCAMPDRTIEEVQ